MRNSRMTDKEMISRAQFPGCLKVVFAVLLAFSAANAFGQTDVCESERERVKTILAVMPVCNPNKPAFDECVDRLTEWIEQHGAEVARLRQQLARAECRFEASDFCKNLPAQGLGALGNPTGKPLGGGVGYGDWVTIPANVVDDADSLMNALESAQPGDIVYVDDQAEIDLSGVWEIPINSGVTLASGRGRNGSPGGLLFTTDEETSAKRALLEVVGPDVRITGLRLRGPNSDRLPPNESTR